ncbi:uncharacterized protein LOC114273569 [Camellia sinensis]|uniref:uncharacterized protein LOC114273569 n=1 Tax=Camellia sinensis TaxID=4442 RepID=UPI0010367F0A|nr:uncharacterized protein LOC114273569 [Camellia sinensis]
MSTDVDVENMFSLARSFGVTHINVVVDSQNEVDDLIRGKQYGGTIFASQMDPNIEQFSRAETDGDLLPNYCRHSEKTLMTVDWSHGISHVGQCFEGGVAAFRLVLSKYVIECGFDFKFVKNDSMRVMTVCTLREQKWCTWWYADAVMQYNPESHVNLGFEQSTGRFKRFFISFKSYIDEFNHVRPLLFLDDIFLKGRFKGNLLAATEKDGNKGLFPLAFIIVNSETTANWTWFLEHLINVVNSAQTLTFVFDRNAGLLESLPTVFLFAHHAYCLQHLQANLRDKLRGEWYGEMTSNAAESFNKWILDARNYPITRLVDTIKNQIMTMRADRKLLATNWNDLLCPKMESCVREAYSNGCTWIVSQANENIYEVHSFPTVLVDIDKRLYSCFQWQLNGFPCAHAVVAKQNSGRDFTCVEPFFTVDQYKAAYFGYIQPIPTVDKPSCSEDDFVIYPLAVKRPPGRPKKNWIPSRGEKLSQIRCDRCGRMGSHNRKTCKEPI